LTGTKKRTLKTLFFFGI